MPRHVAHVAARGLPTPGRLRHQRRILSGLAQRCRPLAEDDAGGSTAGLRPCMVFGFSRRTEPAEAVAALVAHLDAVDPRWRTYLKVYDRSRGGVDHAVRA